MLALPIDFRTAKKGRFRDFLYVWQKRKGRVDMKRWKKFDNRDEEKGKAVSLSTAGEGDTGEKKCSPSQVMCAPQWGGWVAGRPPQPGNPAGDQPGSGAATPAGAAFLPVGG